MKLAVSILLRELKLLGSSQTCAGDANEPTHQLLAPQAAAELCAVQDYVDCYHH